MKYKTKNETKEYRLLFNEAMKHVRNEIKDYNFHHRLIGSAKRNLVIDKPNKGFDFDYQIIFHDSLEGKKSDELIQLKDRFMKAFDNFFADKGYEYGEDSTSAITIRKIFVSKIDHSYDVTLMSPNSNGGLNIMKYQNKEKSIMTLNEMNKSIMFNDKYKKIKGSDRWRELRERYLEKQIEHNGEKKSFSLLMEAVNEISIR